MNRKMRRTMGLKTPLDSEWEPLREIPPHLRVEPAAGYDREAEYEGVSIDEIKARIHRRSLVCRHLANSTYGVTVGPANEEGWLQLSIYRWDDVPVCPWADKQRIKNEVVGVECEAVEIYPAESRLLNIGNVYHLWVNPDPTFRLDLGYHTPRRVEAS